MQVAISSKRKLKLSPELFFMTSALVVNGGNYLYNLLLGRALGPEMFANVAILITLLLVVAFLAMTFQLTVAKFTVELDSNQGNAFNRWIYKRALLIGVALGIIIIVFAPQMAELLQTGNSTMFVYFGIGVPLFFLMSVKRGQLQGSNRLFSLSGSYQAEMWSRLLITVILLFILGLDATTTVSVAIFASFVAGYLPGNFNVSKVRRRYKISKANRIKIYTFFGVTIAYELTQIICNNSDIILVKHYFETEFAGLYASMALIGRVVYFVTWMFVMLLLPKVIQKRKEGAATQPILFRYIAYITFIAVTITALAFLFPETLLLILFGDAYLTIAPLLGYYVLATSLFAISNVFAYYFLSLDKYLPIAISAVMGGIQIASIMLLHDTLFQVVLAQVWVMVGLLAFQCTYFIRSQETN